MQIFESIIFWLLARGRHYSLEEVVEPQLLVVHAGRVRQAAAAQQPVVRPTHVLCNATTPSVILTTSAMNNNKQPIKQTSL